MPFFNFFLLFATTWLYANFSKWCNNPVPNKVFTENFKPTFLNDLLIFSIGLLITFTTLW
ncbi:hypothetical protein [Spiroplasma endosymbiont of Villa modesta]|uniref:hypothetical protein n=1 Tax=Spiroplasma endosymbiont of Villa modesta TaxID=3066293 RepID=UPI00313C6C83